MSRSVSPPSSVTNTSPCWNGFIVPGSTLMYGSSFWSVTRRPRLLSKRPSDDAVSPLPRLEATPPVTKMCFVNPLPPAPFAGAGTRRYGDAPAPLAPPAHGRSTVPGAHASPRHLQPFDVSACSASPLATPVTSASLPPPRARRTRLAPTRLTSASLRLGG